MRKISAISIISLASLLLLSIVPTATFAASQPAVPLGTHQMRGSWTDNFGFVWKLRTSSVYYPYTITGKVNTGSDGGPIYSVSGSGTCCEGSGSTFNMTASQSSNSGYCSSFTYTGTITSKGEASGFWTSACGGSGDFSMTRNNRDTTITVTSGPNPTSK
jgi:hypothetical protein